MDDLRGSDKKRRSGTEIVHVVHSSLHQFQAAKVEEEWDSCLLLLLLLLRVCRTSKEVSLSFNITFFSSFSSWWWWSCHPHFFPPLSIRLTKAQPRPPPSEQSSSCVAAENRTNARTPTQKYDERDTRGLHGWMVFAVVGGQPLVSLALLLLAFILPSLTFLSSRAWCGWGPSSLCQAQGTTNDSRQGGVWMAGEERGGQAEAGREERPPLP